MPRQPWHGQWAASLTRPGTEAERRAGSNTLLCWVPGQAEASGSRARERFEGPKRQHGFTLGSLGRDSLDWV